jgi:hypothetical protein
MMVLGNVAEAPGFVFRHEVGLLPATLPVQPYHAAANLEPAAADELVSHVERAAEEAAVAGLRAVADRLPAAAAVLGVAVVVKTVSVPAQLAEVLRSHAWMHAAEGMLYREAVLAAARRSGWAAHAVSVASLPGADHQLNAIGLAAGRPWRRIEKDAARAAITLLPDGSGRS